MKIVKPEEIRKHHKELDEYVVGVLPIINEDLRARWDGINAIRIEWRQLPNIPPEGPGSVYAQSKIKRLLEEAGWYTAGSSSRQLIIDATAPDSR